jgi:hypothetical protein
MKKRPTLNFNESGGIDDVSSTSSSGARLCVTVIATTAEGTTSAPNEARRLARDLDAHITLLKIEVVSLRFPLDKTPASLDFTIKQQCSLVLRSSARDEDVTIRTCLCRNQEACLRSALRRRALVVIGGRRHWWKSREERLEMALHRLGHHVIFADVDRRSNGVRNPTFGSHLFSGARICDETIPENSISREVNLKRQCTEKMAKQLRIQTADVCEPKFRSMPLCAVDAHNFNLRCGS